MVLGVVEVGGGLSNVLLGVRRPELSSLSLILDWLRLRSPELPFKVDGVAPRSLYPLPMLLRLSVLASGEKTPEVLMSRRSSIC